MAFGYFEALIHHGDTNTLLFEMGRLESMKNIIVTAGFDPMMVEEFADEFRDLLRGINEAMQQGGNAIEVVENAFNDDMQQNYIITHLRVRPPRIQEGLDIGANRLPDCHLGLDEDARRVCAMAARPDR